MQSGFKMFFSFDYLGGTEGGWSQDDIIEIMQAYAANGCYFQYDGRAFVSTFEGTETDQVNAWPAIRAAIDGGLYLVPDWTSLGPNGFDTNLVDGACTCDVFLVCVCSADEVQSPGICGPTVLRTSRLLLTLPGTTTF